MGSSWRGAIAAAVLVCAAWSAAPAQAQTLGDIRAELSLLDKQIGQLRDELIARGAAGGLPTDPATALTRLDQLEAELRRLTGRVDVLTNDVERIVADASNRVGEIEFRLTELEGGDTSVLGEPELLGGGVTRPRPREAEGVAGGISDPFTLGGALESGGGETAAGASPAEPPPAQLAVSEQADFDAAVAAAEAGEPARAAQLFDAFLATYPGGPLSNEAQFRRAEALAAQADWKGAARGFLDAFSGAPEGPFAPSALYQLAISLEQLGQSEEACLTLTEVAGRYPGSEEAGRVAGQRQTFGCP